MERENKETSDLRWKGGEKMEKKKKRNRMES